MKRCPASIMPSPYSRDCLYHVYICPIPIQQIDWRELSPDTESWLKPPCILKEIKNSVISSLYKLSFSYLLALSHMTSFHLDNITHEMTSIMSPQTQFFCWHFFPNFLWIFFSMNCFFVHRKTYSKDITHEIASASVS